MSKYILLLLAYAIFFFSHSLASMHREDLNLVRQRLQQKLAARKGEFTDLRTLGQEVNLPYLSRTLSSLKEPLNTQKEESYRAHKINITIENLKGTKITSAQYQKISHIFNEKNLSLDNVAKIKKNLIASLNSGLKFIKKASDRLNQEKEFHCGNNHDFKGEEAFASDLLPFKDHLRETFVFNIQPFARNGIAPLESIINNIRIEDSNDIKALIHLYTELIGYTFANLDAFQKIQGIMSKMLPVSLVRKSHRLLSSLYDRETEECLKITNLLLPFMTIIHTVIDVQNYDEILTYPKIIEARLEAYQYGGQRCSAFSRAALSSYQERMKKKKTEEELKQKESLKIKTTPSENFNKTPDHNVFFPVIQKIDENFPLPTPQLSSNREEKENIDLSRTEDRDRRKRKAKEDKKLRQLQTLDVLKEITNEKQKETPTIEKALTLPYRVIEIGGGSFKTFEKIIKKTFKGSMDKIIWLIENLNGNVDEGRSGSRIKFQLPHISGNHDAFLDMLSSNLKEDENSNISSQYNTQPGEQKITIHAPHKKQSNKLRPYHIEDIREFLLKAGYNIKSVKKRNLKEGI